MNVNVKVIIEISIVLRSLTERRLVLFLIEERLGPKMSDNGSKLIFVAVCSSQRILDKC